VVLSGTVGWVLAGMIILNVVCALISGMAGLKLLRKQFEKAGVTA